MDEHKVKLGDLVEFKLIISKKRGWGAVTFDGRNHYADMSTWPVEQLPQAKTGIVCGKRVLQEGRWDQEDGYFSIYCTVPVYLVATNMGAMYRVPCDKVRVIPLVEIVLGLPASEKLSQS